nr:hypothetical protein Q903MT_gene2983 [Picea sitchensis]
MDQWDQDQRLEQAMLPPPPLLALLLMMGIALTEILHR